MMLIPKIELYGTLGPSDCDKRILKELFQNGMTGIRLNLSHRSLAECEDWLSQLHQAAEELHIVPDLLVDLQGPEVRIGDLKSPLTLRPGDCLCLGPEGQIPVPDCVLPFLKEGQQVLLDDGKLLLEIREESRKEAIVINGGLLLSRKSLALPGQTIQLPALTDKDLENLALLSRYRVTGVMLPFVRGPEDLIQLKKALLTYKNSRVRIFAKIENQAGIDRLPDLIPHCDQVVIARGDLGNAVSLTRLPAIQKDMARLLRRTKTPFMVVTQLLASMEKQPVPTRAEVSDIFNAVLDGASSLMLTGETAVGHYPVEAMRILSDVAYEALRYRMESRFKL